jgi:hypothetical protein
MERYADVYGRDIRYGELPPHLNAVDRKQVAEFVDNLKAVGEVLAELEDVWDATHRTALKIRLLRQQREEHRATRRIRRSLEAAEAEMTRLRREYEKVDKALSTALLTG